MSEIVPGREGGRVVALISAVGRLGLRAGRRTAERVSYLGGATYLLLDTAKWLAKSLLTRQVKMNWTALATQMVRVGVRSISIVVLVQTFIGVILALQVAPVLNTYGSIDQIAYIVAIAMFRELGPLLSAVVLSGFAGASIAAEIGAMVEAEEIKALRAHALDPVRFLVMPRFLATVIMLVGLAVVADVVGVSGGLLTSWLLLDINPSSYLENTRVALVYRDFITGLVKAGVFGTLISMIACYEGLNVTGGAEGVGRATTATVVKSIVALIVTDCIFTTGFYLLGW
jgi:phospholipid/cholesterol/gamma-HCH transport system permease protein